jgi:hypothetical protein
VTDPSFFAVATPATDGVSNARIVVSLDTQPAVNVTSLVVLLLMLAVALNCTTPPFATSVAEANSAVCATTATEVTVTGDGGGGDGATAGLERLPQAISNNANNVSVRKLVNFIGIPLHAYQIIVLGQTRLPAWQSETEGLQGCRCLRVLDLVPSSQFGANDPLQCNYEKFPQLRLSFSVSRITTYIQRKTDNLELVKILGIGFVAGAL